MGHQTDYIREYYRKRRARLYAEAPDPETHPLRIWRKEHGLSLAAAGRLFGVSDAAVWGWERGLVPTPEWVTDIIQEGMSEYTQRKIRESEAQYQERIRLNPTRLWRASRGMSQKELARRLGVTQNRLSSWETGNRPTPEWVTKRLEEL